MKVTGSIIMYSGRRDPETEFDEATAKEIASRLYNLADKCDNIPNYKLGFRGYRVIWNPEVEGAPWVAVQAHEGVVEICCFGVRSAFKDTVNLESYLKDLLTPVLHAHYEEGRRQMDEYFKKLSTDEGFKEEHEKVLALFKQEKI